MNLKVDILFKGLHELVISNPSGTKKPLLLIYQMFRMRVMQWRRGRVAKMVGLVCVGALVLFGLVRHFGMEGDIGSTFNAQDFARPTCAAGA